MYKLKHRLLFKYFSKAIGILSLCFLLASCASFPKRQPQVEALTLGSNYKQALEIIKNDKKAYGTNNELLYLLDKGFLEHLDKNYEESINTFAKAQQKFDQLYTESLSKIAATWVLNDYSADYHGEDFEHVLINVFQALNYLMLGKYDDAMVEARDVDSKLNAINSQYKKDQKNVYKEDAFIRLLMGVFYEAGNLNQDINDAYVSYIKAAEIYENDYNNNYDLSSPEILKENILTTAKAMGWIEYNKAKSKYPHTKLIPLKQKRASAEIYLIQYNGVAPKKIENSLTIPMLDGHIVKVAFPKYVRRQYAINHSELIANSNKTIVRSKSQKVQDIGSIAIKNLDRRKARFIAKSILRASGRYMIEKKQEENIEKKQGKGLASWFNFFSNIYNIMIEKADLRCWRTLPDEMLLSRVILDPGYYNFQLENFNESGSSLGILEIGDFEVQAKQKMFFIMHTTN